MAITFLDDNTPKSKITFLDDAENQAPQAQSSNVTLESIAQPLREAGKAVAPYTQQVMSQPDVQPFSGANPFTKPQGGPVQQVLGSMRQVGSLPLRYSATLGQASQPISEFTAEQLGKMGANPYASATAGMVAGIVADPRSWTPIGGVSANHPDSLPTKVAVAREARTGVPARQFQALYKDPGAIFAGQNVAKAGEDIGTAKGLAGINPGVTNDISTLTPENIERINPTKAIKLDDINNVISKLQNKSPVSPQEAERALDSVNSILAQSSIQNNRDVFRQWSAIKSHINNVLGDVAPDVRAANKAFSREMLGQDFSSMDALNKNGKPSKLGLMARSGMAALGGVIGHAVADSPTIGAGIGYEVGKTANQLYHAPYIAGLQTAGEAVANRAIHPLLETLEKMGTSPQAQALIARYLAATNQSRSGQ